MGDAPEAAGGGEQQQPGEAQQQQWRQDDAHAPNAGGGGGGGNDPRPKRSRDDDYAHDDRKRNSGYRGDSVFRLLVPQKRVGCIIGKGGSVIKSLQDETGARIKILARPARPI